MIKETGSELGTEKYRELQNCSFRLNQEAPVLRDGSVL